MDIQPEMTTPSLERPSLRPNEVQLFGQRFHACVAVYNVGLGLILGNAVHRWFPDAAAWLSPIGLAMLLAGAAWWLLEWRRQRSSG